MAREDEIRLIAYRIWEEEGCPTGLGCDHWYKAEAIWEQLQQESAKVSEAETKPKARRVIKTQATKARESKKGTAGKTVRKSSKPRSQKSE